MGKIPNLKKWKNNEIFNARDYVFERDTVVDEVNDQDTRLTTAEDEIVRVEGKFDGEIGRIDSVAGIDSGRIDDLETDVTALENTRLNRDGSNAEANIKIIDTTFKTDYDDRNAIQDLDFKNAPAKGATATSSSFNSNTGMQQYHNKIQEQITDKVDKTITVAGQPLSANVTTEQIKTAIGLATEQASGLLSATDKERLNTIISLLGTSQGDENEVVDTIKEVLAIFDEYPEGADLVTALGDKVDVEEGKGLSANDFTQALKEKLDGIVAGANPNVQANFAETDSNSDAFILNKPDLSLKMNTSGDNSNIDVLKFKNLDTEDALSVGEIRLNKNLPEWQVSANTKHLVGRQLLERAINVTGTTLSVGTPLFISGIFTPGQGTNPAQAFLANRNTASQGAAFAVASCPSNNQEEGCIIRTGTVAGWDTSAFSAGNSLYLTDTAGQYSTTPVGDGGIEFFVGTVIRAEQNGLVFLNPTRIVDGLFVLNTKVGGSTNGNIPIIGEDGLILPQYLGEAYSDVYVGYGTFDLTDPQVPVLLELYPPDQWDTGLDEPIQDAQPFEKKTNTLYISKNVTANTTYRYSTISNTFVGLAPSPIGLGTTASTAYPGNEGQANRTSIINIVNGTTTVDKANKDGSGNTITATYVNKDEILITPAEEGESNVNQLLVNDGTKFVNQAGTKGLVGLGNVLNYGIASEQDAKDGSSNEVYMTPLRTKDAVIAFAPEVEFEPHVTAEYPHQFTDGGVQYEWGIAVQDGQLGIIYREVTTNE